MCQGVARRAGGVASALVGGASGHCQKLSLRFFSGEGSPQRLVYGRGGRNGRHRSSASRTPCGAVTTSDLRSRTLSADAPPAASAD